MKHTIEELHFAAKVRDLAVNLRKSELSAATSQWGEGKSLDERNAGINEFSTTWYASHPISEYVKEAYQLIHGAATIISEIRNDSH